MAAIRIVICAAVAAFAAPALTARPAIAPAPAPAPAPAAIAASGFALTDGSIPPAASVQASSRALARDRAQAGSPGKGTQFRNITVGPSWSYQTSHTGPVFEMGALGGGVVEDRPRLAHVAFAWQF